MTVNGKRYLVIAETKETTRVRKTRPIFRKVFCPFCGAQTGLFRRDGDETPGGQSHTLRCDYQNGEVGVGTKSVPSAGD